MLSRRTRFLPFLCLLAASAGYAQEHPSAIPPGYLDPTRGVDRPELFSSFHKPLPEQYIWTREDSAVSNLGVIHYTTPGLNEKTEPHYFRVSFDLEHVPAAATLYLAGPRSIEVYVNGSLVEKVAADTLNPLDMHVFRADVASLLKPGRNVLAVSAVRGHAVPGFVNSTLAMQQIFGEVMVAKIVPAPAGVDAPAILISGPQWKATLHATDGWERPDYDDAVWPDVATISPIEGSIDLFQWNADAGLYDWPGYEGESPFLAHMYLPAMRVEDIALGRSQFENLDALTAPDERGPEEEFTVKLSSTAPGDEFAPGLTLDMGREVTGLSRLVGDAPVQQHVNGIPGYSSFWFTGLEDYLRHTGDRAYLKDVHPQLLQLLQLMDKEFDTENRFMNRTNAWLFVDWAPGLNGDTPETRRATTIEYYRAYLAGADLLREVGDTDHAEYFTNRAASIKASLQKTISPDDGFYGPRCQTNAMAVLSGVAGPDQYDAIWKNVLSKVDQPTYRPDLITPYYGAYVLDAMAEMGRRAEALKWIRDYWGGMINEGATSFWEAYDPSWPKDNPHIDLQADGRTGYFVSLAHGWSAGPTYWMMEQILGIRPTAEGFSETVIRPDLVGLKWARGKEPTPKGLLKVDLHDESGLRAAIDLPDGVHATVLFPISQGLDHVMVNGAARQGPLAEDGSRIAIMLDVAGHYELQAQ